MAGEIANKAVNKVEINGVVKLDLTEDTVTAKTLLFGYKAHDKSGQPVLGTLVVKPEQEKTVNITSNDFSTKVFPDTGKTLSGVNITVKIPAHAYMIESDVVMDDGILTLVLDKQDYDAGYCDFMVVEAVYAPSYKTVMFKYIAQSNVYYAVFSSSGGLSVSSNLVTVTESSTDVTIVANLSDSGGNFYIGKVNVYGWKN